MLKHNRGYTLVEMLMATVLTLMMMSAVVGLFESVGKGISNSRALLDTNDRLRMAAFQLQRDLGGVTVPMQPPRRPEDNEGYFEYIEGPSGPVFRPEVLARYFDRNRTATAEDAVLYDPDTTAADNDDILLFTTRTTAEPFSGRPTNPATGALATSTTAEVAWFLRGRTLYRRVLLVAPTSLTAYDTNSDGVLDHQDSAMSGTTSYYSYFDVSARPVFNNTANGTDWVANTLGDLTKRESRFAHLRTAPYVSGVSTYSDTFPYSVSRWGQLGLPLACECAAASWMDWQGAAAAPSAAYTCPIDYWQQPHPWAVVNGTTGALTAYTNNNFVGDDVVLTNVIGFDVKAWDPNAPVLRYRNTATGAVIATLLPGDPGYLYGLTQLNAADPYDNANAVAYAIIGFGAYVDLNYMCQLGAITGGGTFPNPNYTPPTGASLPLFHGAGNYRSGLRGVEPFAKTNLNNPFYTSDIMPGGVLGAAYQGYSTYDTWSTHYENDGVQQYGTAADTGVNGIDDSGRNANGVVQPPDGVVDDPSEADTSPPYPVPLRGIQVTIRVYEPSTRQVRQRTIQQDFLAK